MSTVKTPLSKTEERQALARFLDDLPAGYLRDILGELAPFIDQAIACDHCFTLHDLREREAEARALRQEAKALRAEIENLRGDLYKLENTREQLHDRARDTASALESLAAKLRQVAPRT